MKGVKTEAVVYTAADSRINSYQSGPSGFSASASSGQPRILDLRIGNHPGKTRLVFDVEKPIDFQTQMIDGGKALVVRFDQGGWAGSAKGLYSSHELLQGYQAGAVSDGSEIRFDLKKPADVSMKTVYPPNETYNNYRIVVDLSVL